jgi:hypothetical protein
MKKYILLAITFFVLSCSKDNELTEIKYNGYGGISSKVNGEILKPKGGGIYGNTDCRFNTVNGVTNFAISYINQNYSDNILRSIRIVAINVDYNSVAEQTFNLKEEQNNESFATYDKSINYEGDSFQTNTIQKGELKILYHDKEKNIIGGTFWFDAKNSSGEIIKVTEGRFDTFIN